MPDHSPHNLPFVVTGADGRVGRLLQAAWARRPPECMTPVWCARRAGFWRDLLAAPLDPAPPRAVVLHLAADLSLRSDASTRSVATALAVVRAARQGRARHMFLASTAAVYAPADRDLDEDADCQPPTAYGRAKLAAEAAVRAAAGDLPVTMLRIGNVVGAGALIGPAPPTAEVLLDPVPGRDGGPLRSWIAPGDLLQILSRLAGLVGTGTALPTVLNLASPGAWSMAALLDAAGYSWTFGPDRAQVLPRLTLDTRRLAALCPGLTAPTPADMLADLRRTLEHAVSV